MQRKRLLWRIYVSFLLSTMAALAITAVYGLRSLRAFHQAEVSRNLLVRAQIIASDLQDKAPFTESAGIDAYCKKIGRLTQTRVTVVRPDGVVIGDSDEDIALMNNHRSRPEIAAALLGTEGQSVRFSDTLRRNLMYVAVPLRHGAETVAVIRAAMPLTVVDWALHTVYRHVLLAGLTVAGLFALVALYLARRITAPLSDMQSVTERIAAGDLAARMAVPDDRELAAVAETFNQMAAQLNERMRTIERQRNEQDAVFSSMVEGVLAVDLQERIIRLNQSAASLLGIDPRAAVGRSVLEAVRNPDLQSFISGALRSHAPSEAEIVVYENADRRLSLHGTSLADSGGRRIGALVVLNDVTRLRRLEMVRQEFVANVSHELKTPITAIKGCTETLREVGAEKPDDALRFLDMLARHADRLEAIVEDLLVLSRIESDAEHGRVRLEVRPIGGLIQRAVQTFARKAAAKEIEVRVACPPDLAAPLNDVLLEQAVGNLLDNAIKYSGPRTVVLVSAETTDNGIQICVTDRGPGIEKKHLERIFERFYRIDPARSRAMGGTGLGLAIVKHIALAHRGAVSVESTPGQGSTFAIRIPKQ